VTFGFVGISSFAFVLLTSAVSLLCNLSKEYNLEIVTRKTKVFGFVRTDDLTKKIIINDETLEQVSQFS